MKTYSQTKKFLITLLNIFILLFTANYALAASIDQIIDSSSVKNKYPSVEEAFSFNAAIKEPNKITLTIEAIPNTYLYNNAFKFSVDANNKNAITLDKAILPSGEIIEDPHFGKTKVFSNKFIIVIPYQLKTNKQLNYNLIVDYQGCLKDTLCYPPKTINLNLKTGFNDQANYNDTATSSNINQTIADKDIAFELLKGAKVWSIIAGFFLFGLLLSMTPCVLPMLPILSGIIVGHKNQISKRQAFKLSLVYVLSMATTYMVAGILISAASLNLVSSLQQPIVIIAVCIIFILLAIASFGYWELGLPHFITNKLNKKQKKLTGGNYFSVAFMGVLSSLIISPCATAPLAGALLYISSTGNIWLGGVALFSMGIAMGVPLLIFGTSAGHWLPKAGPWMREINIFFGVVFVGLAIYLLSRIINGPVILIIWALLLIFYAVHLGLLEPAQNHGWPKMKKGFALIFAIYGGLLLAGATQNNTDLLHPLGLAASKNEHYETTNIEKLEFKIVKNLTDLKANLKAAQNNGEFTILDVYAKWCVSCRTIDEKVLTDPRIKTIISKFNRIKIDLTDYNNHDKAILSALSIFNPPTIIFFDPSGKEIKNSRVTSAIDSEGLLKLLNQISNKDN